MPATATHEQDDTPTHADEIPGAQPGIAEPDPSDVAVWDRAA